jgi:hypothetical protein
MPRLASLILVLVVFAAPSRRVALALARLPPPPPADADADAGRLAWLSLGDVPTTPNVCEGSFDASLNANAAACDVVTGSLLVSARLPRAFDDARLARVDGDVLVRDNAVETSLRGAFPALTRVGGDVVVDNTRLVYLAIFPALEEVGGGVFVLNNARVLRFGDGERAAFARLVRVGGDVVLANNAARTLDGACFPAARRVGGGVVVRDSPALTSIGDGGGVVVARAPEPPPFASLEAVAGDVVVARCDALTRVAGAFRRLARVDRDVRLETLPSLVEIEGAFATLDRVLGSLRLLDAPRVTHAKKAFLSLRYVAGDVKIEGCDALAALDGGTLNGLAQIGGSLIVRRTSLASASFLFSLSSVIGDVRFESNAKLRSLDGLQNVRYVGGGLALQGLVGAFGRCGEISEATGVAHACYARQYRFCQPLVKTRGWGSSAAGAVPGWYRCVESVMTTLLNTPELKTTASVVLASGLQDALQTPRAAVTMFAPTDVAWLKTIGPVDQILARGGSDLADVVLAHVVRGVFPSSGLRADDAMHTLLLGLGIKVGVTPGVLPAPPAKITRCKAQPGTWAECAGAPTRKVSIAPFAWLPLRGVANEFVRESRRDTSSTEELLAAFQRSAVDAYESEVDAAAAAAEEEEEGNDGEDLDDAGAPSENADARTTTLTLEDVLKSHEASTAWAAKAREANAHAARLVLPNLKAGNGYVHVIDAALTPANAIAPTPPAPPPGPRTPSSFSPLQTLLVTRPPPPPAVFLNAPPPVLTPISQYFIAPPPPPGRAPPTPSPPPGGGGNGGSCVAQAPNICGLCDYTYQDDPDIGTCCCDASCLEPENGDCCVDYEATCGGAQRAREETEASVGVE